MQNLNKIINYFHPYRILDIGCHCGGFYSYCKNLYPSSYYFLIEGNKNCENYLKNFLYDYDYDEKILLFLVDLYRDIYLYNKG